MEGLYEAQLLPSLLASISRLALAGGSPRRSRTARPPDLLTNNVFYNVMLARRLHRALNPSGRRCLHPAPLAAPVSTAAPDHRAHHRRAALQHRRLSSGPDMSVSPAAATRPARRHTASAGRTRSAAPLAGVQRGPGQDAGGALHPRRRRRQRGRAGHQEERAPDGRALDAPGRHPAPRILRLPLQPAERYARPAPAPQCASPIVFAGP